MKEILSAQEVRLTEALNTLTILQAQVSTKEVLLERQKKSWA